MATAVPIEKAVVGMAMVRFRSGFQAQHIAHWRQMLCWVNQVCPQCQGPTGHCRYRCRFDQY